MMGKFNRLVLGYWTPTGWGDSVSVEMDSKTDTPQMADAWIRLPTPMRQKMKKFYNDAGIAVMIGAFGPGQNPTMQDLDPHLLGQQVGRVVRDFDFDGVDIDYQGGFGFKNVLTADFGAMANGWSRRWMNSK